MVEVPDIGDLILVMSCLVLQPIRSHSSYGCVVKAVSLGTYKIQLQSEAVSKEDEDQYDISLNCKCVLVYVYEDVICWFSSDSTHLKC